MIQHSHINYCYTPHWEKEIKNLYDFIVYRKKKKKQKPFNQLDTEETYLNIKKATEEKAHS